MFQLICDPSGVVVEITLKELVPAVLKWGNKLDHILRVLLSHILSSAQVHTFFCSVASHLGTSFSVANVFFMGILFLKNCSVVRLFLGLKGL